MYLAYIIRRPLCMQCSGHNRVRSKTKDQD